MRSTDRLRVAIGAAGLVALAVFTAAPAVAEAAEDHAWAATGPLAPATAEDDRIYVSQIAGEEQARAFVRVPGRTAAELRRGEVTLTEGEGGLSPESAELQACATHAPVTGSGKVDEAPDVDCTTPVRLVRDADGRWLVPLGALADAMSGPAAGWFAITPVPEASAPAFTVAFDPAQTRIEVPDDEPEEAPPAAAGPAAGASGSDERPTTTPVPTFSVPDLGPILGGPEAEVPPSERVEDAAPTPAPSSPARDVGERRVVPRAAEPTAVVLLGVAVVAALALWARGRWLPPVLAPAATVQQGSIVSASGLVALFGLVLLMSDAAIYKLGFIGIVFIAAIGLHLLVNWAGELSLAHAGFVGLPAFAVGQLTHHTGWTPILFLPVGVAVGVLLGLLVAIPARRARGLQVALVTLAIGIAITQFLFVRSWVIGPPSGLNVPVPSLFGIRFETSRSLLPVLVAVIVVAVLAARAIMNSTIGRALSQLRAVPDAAAIAGVPVAAYRGAAYAFAGAFAGLAGGAYVLWVQRVGPQAFPLNLGFTYLVIATLAGKGGLLGVAIAAVALEGGRLFSIIPESIGLYLGPIALIYNVTRYQEGINGLLRQAGRQLRTRKEKAMEDRTKDLTPRAVGPIGTALRLPVVIAGVLVAVGFGAIALAWYHAGNTDQLWIQNQEVLSGGFGGGALVVLGAALLIRDALLHGPAVARRDSALTPED